MGDFESGGILNPVVIPKSLSAEALEQGWTYFILEPGIYYLGFQGQRRTDAFTYDAQWQKVQRWRMDIGPGSPIVYAGTIHLQCESDWFLFGAKYCCFIRKETIRNEQELARTLVSENLGTMGPPKTALMEIHTGETIILGTPKPEE